MIEGILNSKLKKTVLAVLLIFPKRGFSPQEIAVMARVSARMVSECLRDLVRAEIVETAAKKGKRYFRLNPYFPNGSC